MKILKTDLFNCSIHSDDNPNHWCEYKENYLRRQDAKDFWDRSKYDSSSWPQGIWGNPDPSNIYSTFGMSVPIVPSLGVWTDVYIQSNDERTVLQVTWEDKFLCFLTEGEGRLVIRSCIIDILRSEDIKCSAEHHGYKAETEFTRYREDTPEYWRNKFHLHKSKHCYACTVDLFAEGDQMASDLIPDKEGVF